MLEYDVGIVAAGLGSVDDSHDLIDAFGSLGMDDMRSAARLLVMQEDVCIFEQRITQATATFRCPKGGIVVGSVQWCVRRCLCRSCFLGRFLEDASDMAVDAGAVGYGGRLPES